ncbi:MAG: DNA internalization-related competence protein ComEC/Rec2 [Candidatus Binatia bacterium]
MQLPIPSPRKKNLLEKNPAALVVVPTLSLLLGQAIVASSSNIVTFIVILCLIASLTIGLLGRKKWALLLIFSSLAFSIGYGMHHRLLHPRFPKDHLRQLSRTGTPLYVEGVMFREPERQPHRSRWFFRAERIWHPTGAHETEGDVLVTVRDVAGDWHYGDLVRFRLKMRPPRSAGNPGEFDYGVYLARRKIYLIGFLENDAGVELVRRESFTVWGFIEHLRGKISRFLERQFPRRQSALMKALVVGDKGALSQEMREGFTAAGVAHLLSISGLHVGMLGLVVFFFARFLGSFSTSLLLRWNWLKVATFVSFLAVLFYTVLAGARIPTVRAGIMVGSYVLAVMLDREENIFSSLAFSALLIGLFWPGAIMDISFQLSFLAVLFIVWGLRKIQEVGLFLNRDGLAHGENWYRRRVRQLMLYLAVPVLAALGTGPIVAYHFGRLSLAGFFSNAVIVPLVGFLLVPLGLMIGFVSLIFPVLALPLVWLARPLLALSMALVQFFSNLPMAQLSVPMPNLLEVSILYLMIFSLLCVRRKVLFYLVFCISLLAVVGDGIYWWQQRWNRKELRMTHLSVGHGDAAVVEFPGSKVLLIDAGGGSTRRFDPGKSIIAPFLRSRKIKKVDYLLVTHPRVDHYGGMKSVVEEFSPSEFWSGPLGAPSKRYLELEETLDKWRVKRVVLSKDDSCLWIDRARLCFLYPAKGIAGEASVVLRLSIGQYHFLLAGDIKKKGERNILRSRVELASQVLKVPRHGSLSSSTEPFIAAVKPKLAIFSVGHGSRFGLPNEEVVERFLRTGSMILRTDRDGAVQIETDGESLRYRTYRSRKRGEFDN